MYDILQNHLLAMIKFENLFKRKKLALLLDENLLKEIWEKFIKIYKEVPLFNLTKEVVLDSVKIITCFDKMMKLQLNSL